MGKLIICNSRRATEPYLFHNTGIVVYSIEELCYYISNYLCFVSLEDMHSELFEWLDRELGLTKTSERLYELVEAEADLKTMITVLLCSCDYYMEDEIKEILSRFDGLKELPYEKLESFRAKNYINEQNYKLAADIYERLINQNSMEGKEKKISLTSAEYSEILHNLTVAKIHLYGLSECYEGFLEAYIRSGNEESLKQYLLSLLLLGHEEKLMEQAIQYGLTRETIETANEKIALIKEEAKEKFEEGHRLRMYLREGRMPEFYYIADTIVHKWMDEYRRGK